MDAVVGVVPSFACTYTTIRAIEVATALIMVSQHVEKFREYPYSQNPKEEDACHT